MEAYSKVLSIAIPGFLLLIVIESLIARWQGLQVNRPMDTISSLSSGTTNTLKALLGIAIVIISYGWLEARLGLFEIQSTVLLYLLAFVGHDFAGYWSHRFNHKINVLWNRHIIHHSSEEFNLSCALRQEISAFVGVYFFLYIPMAFIGIPAEVVAVVAPIHLFAQFWYHTRVINKMGFLEHIIVTPSHHRVHHAINAEYIDKNFSEIFIVWDKWFGTFQPELQDVPPIYGTKRPAGSWNPVIINFMHLAMLARDAWYTSRWWDKLRLWFMPTGWRPADVEDRFPVASIGDVYNRAKYDTPASAGFQAWSWTQLIVANILMYILMANLSELSYPLLAVSVLFLFLSIFAYTSLMDRHWISVPAEIIKVTLGFGLLWFVAERYAELPNAWQYVFAGYLLISILATLSFYYRDRAPKALFAD